MEYVLRAAKGGSSSGTSGTDVQYPLPLGVVIANTPAEVEQASA